MDWEIRYKKILKGLELVNSGYYSPQEFILDMESQGVLEPVVKEIIEVERPLKTTPEEQAYQREYRKWLKQQKEIKSEEELKQQKINKALQRTNFVCYDCRKGIKDLDSQKNTYELKIKPNQIKQSIIVSNICPFCEKKVSAFGGLV